MEEAILFPSPRKQNGIKYVSYVGIHGLACKKNLLNWF